MASTLNWTAWLTGFGLAGVTLKADHAGSLGERLMHRITTEPGQFLPWSEDFDIIPTVGTVVVAGFLVTTAVSAMVVIWKFVRRLFDQVRYRRISIPALNGGAPFLPQDQSRDLQLNAKPPVNANRPSPTGIRVVVRHSRDGSSDVTEVDITEPRAI